MHTSGGDEAVQALVLGGDIRYGRIESGSVLNIDLAVVDGAAELVNTLLSLEELRRWLRKAVNAVYWRIVSLAVAFGKVVGAHRDHQPRQELPQASTQDPERRL